MTSVDGTPRATWLIQEHALSVLEKFVRACDAVGIDVVAVKGILSARTLYDDISERVISDVDVRVRPRDVSRVERLAREQKWTIVSRTHAYNNLVVVIDGRHVDVEAHVGPPGVCTLTIDELIMRATREDRTFGFSAWVADPHDHALVLVLNAFKDHMAQAMAWAIGDLSKLLDAPWFDEAELIARAKEARAETVLWIVADWMARFMSDDAWGDLRDRMGKPARAGFASAHLWLESIGSAGEFPLRVLARFASDSPRQWGHAFARLVAWQAEVWASQMGATPWRRGVTKPPERVHRGR